MGSYTRKLVLVSCVGALAVACGGGKGGGTQNQDGVVARELALGKAALEDALVTQSAETYLSAATHFSSAAGALETDHQATEAMQDEARFFGGLARIALVMRPFTDGQSDGLRDAGDVLDALGLGTTAAQWSHLDTQAPPFSDGAPAELAADSPDSGTLQQFASSRVAASLREAVSLLEAVRPGFAAEIGNGGSPVELDSTDALFARAAAQGLLAFLELQSAYDLGGVDVDALQDGIGESSVELGTFLDEHPQLLRLAQAAALPSARTDALASIDGLQAALARLRAETDGQENDLVRVAEEQCEWDGQDEYICERVYNPAEEIAEFEEGLAEIEAALGSTAAAPYVFKDDTAIDASKLFTLPGIDLRSKLPRTFTAGVSGDRPGPFADPSFDLFFVRPPKALATDADEDGSPDLFGYTRLFPAFVDEKCFTSYGAASYRSLCFHSVDRFVYWTGEDSFSGTYACVDGALTLTFATPVPEDTRALTSMTLVASEIPDDSRFLADVTYRYASGADRLAQAFWER